MHHLESPAPVSLLKCQYANTHSSGCQDDEDDDYVLDCTTIHMYYVCTYKSYDILGMLSSPLPLSLSRCLSETDLDDDEATVELMGGQFQEVMDSLQAIGFSKQVGQAREANPTLVSPNTTSSLQIYNPTCLCLSMKIVSRNICCWRLN